MNESSSKKNSKESWEHSPINFGKGDFDVVYPYENTITSSTHIFCPLIEALSKPGNAN